MAIRRYTQAQLIALRESPLVAKPDHLPAIEQWIEYVYLDRGDGVREKLRIPHSDNAPNGSSGGGQQAKQPGSNKSGNRLGGAAASESSPMGSFSTGRPTMTGGRGRADREDVSLGPPRTVFASSRNAVPKLSDFQDRSSADTTTGDDPDSARNKFFEDRRLNRKSMNNETEGGGKTDRDSWTNAREKREERGFGRHDREDGERRNGFGDRHDPRWSNNREERRNGDRPSGGWREREQQKRERDGDRGHAEKEPEWMDEPLAKQEQELGFDMGAGARTQDEFQKWKESMKSKKPKAAEEEVKPAQEAPVQAAQTPAPAPEPKPTVAPLKLQEGFDSSLFSGWSGNASGNAVSAPGATGSIKATSGKPKTSRFASMFKPAAEELPPPPPEESNIQQAANAMAKTSAEEQEGFNRVLQMLGSAKLAPEPTPHPPPPHPPPQESNPTSPAPLKASGTNGTSAAGKPKSRFTSMFAQKSPAPQSPQSGGVQLGGEGFFGSSQGRDMTDEASNGFLGQRHEQQIPRTQAMDAPTPNEPSGIPFNAMREQQPRPMSGRNSLPMFDAPSRGAASPEINLQSMLAQQQRHRQGQPSQESQQLLNLLRAKEGSSSRPPSQQALPAGAMTEADIQRLMQSQHRSPMPAEPHAPKPRLPQQAAGMFEDQLMRNFAQDPRPDPDAQRRTSQRVPPPGFYDESIFLQQQQQAALRRQFQQDGPPQPPPPQQLPPGIGPSRRMSGHPSLPPMHIPPGVSQQQQQQFPGAEFPHQLTSPIGAGGNAPPGFNHMPRQPPGFHNINIFQNPGQNPGPQQQQPRAEGPPPPGFGGNGMQSPPGFFGGQQGMGFPPGLPPVRSPMEGGMPPGFDLRGGMQRR